MKNLFLSAGLLFSGLATYGQTCTHEFLYNDPLNWTVVDVSDVGLVSPSRIQVSGGQVQFINAIDGPNDTRVYRDLNVDLCENFVVDFEFEVTAVGDGLGGANGRTIGHSILALTENNLNWIEDENSVRSDNDAILVHLVDGNATGASDMRMQVKLKDGANNPVTACESPFLLLNNLYSVRLERLGPDKGRVTLFDEEQEPAAEIYSSCFDIEGVISNLRYIQHSNSPSGTRDRQMSGTVDNTCIKNCYTEDDCCIGDEIVGPGTICTAGLNSNSYSFNGSSSADYVWSLPAGVTFTGQGTNSINVNSWGTTSGQVTISLQVTCNCKVYNFTKVVTIYPSLEGLGSSLSATITDNGNGTVQIDGSSSISGTGITHSWVIYEAANCDEGDKTILNELTNPQPVSVSYTTSTFNDNSGLSSSKCYVVVYTVSYDNGLCSYEYRSKLTNSGFSKMSLGTQNGSAFAPYQNGVELSSSQIMLGLPGERAAIELGDVYPNPADHSVTIDIAVSGETQLRVVNQNGQTVKEMKLSEGQMNFSTSSMASGVYWFVFETENGKRLTKEVVVTH
ncbi:MAG: T9SS type A sorting domain-containing protein [Bacteroidetes bacterium]|nr:MAG: T9SS type A sorting domain-containing protein [Bacteroidota bacterium]